MREIKFRGQCAMSKELVFGDLIHGVGPKKDNIYILPLRYNLAYVKYCDPLDGVRIISGTESQYTGLQDKNKIDIYEGDIIQTVAPDGERLSIFEVKWCNSLSRFRKYREDGEIYDIDIISENLKEVIGNIYQNPELLK